MHLPWKAMTPQVKGRKVESKAAKRYGATLHPGSGSGGIKFDMSNEESVIEHKDALKSYTVNVKYIAGIFKNAVQQDKQPVLIIQFPDYVLECVIRRNTPHE